MEEEAEEGEEENEEEEEVDEEEVEDEEEVDEEGVEEVEEGGGEAEAEDADEEEEEEGRRRHQVVGRKTIQAGSALKKKPGNRGGRKISKGAPPCPTQNGASVTRMSWALSFTQTSMWVADGRVARTTLHVWPRTSTAASS